MDTPAPIEFVSDELGFLTRIGPDVPATDNERIAAAMRAWAKVLDERKPDGT